MDANNILITVISVMVGPVLGLLVALIVSSRSLRGVLAQAEVAVAAETEKARKETAADARKSRDEVTASYVGLIAALGMEVERLRKQANEMQERIGQLQVQVNTATGQSQILADANAILTLKVASLEAEAERMRKRYGDLEDQYVGVMMMRGASGMGPADAKP